MPTHRTALRCERCPNFHHVCPGVAGHRLHSSLEPVPPFRQDCLVQTRLGRGPIRQEPTRVVRVRGGPRPPRHVVDRKFLPHHHSVVRGQLVGGFGAEVLPPVTLTRPHLGQVR